MTNQMIFIKMGGSSITNSETPKTARRGEIRRLFREIMEAKDVKEFDLIIGHGSGSFGHAPSLEYRINEISRSDRESLIGTVVTEQETSLLNRIVIETALKLDIPVFSFPPHSLGLASNLEFKISYVDHIINAIKIGFIPLTYGDIVIDTHRGASDIATEEVLRALSHVIRPDIVVVGTDVDGLFNKDPKVNVDATLIRMVTSSNISEALDCAGKSTKVDSTGGMQIKVSSLYNTVMTSGAIGYIINLTKKGILKDLLLGKDVIGTMFKPE